MFLQLPTSDLTITAGSGSGAEVPRHILWQICCVRAQSWLTILGFPPMLLCTGSAIHHSFIHISPLTHPAFLTELWLARVQRDDARWRRHRCGPQVVGSPGRRHSQALSTIRGIVKDSPAAHWLGLGALPAEDPDSIPGQGPKISQAWSKTNKTNGITKLSHEKS